MPATQGDSDEGIGWSAVVFLVLFSASAHAQWVKVPQPKIPRTADGKPNLSAPAPRTAYGKPDLSGIWNVDNKYVRDLAADFPADYVPYQPWAKTLFDQRKDGAHSYEDNAAHCLPPGTPRVNAAPFPWKLVQQPDYILIVYENFNMWRQIFLDGRVIAEDAVPTWFGYSTGKWEEIRWLSTHRDSTARRGLIRAADLRRIFTCDRAFYPQRFCHMEIKVTIADPKAYTKPWTMTEPAVLTPKTELMEFICGENNRDLEHLPGR
jgi:hypothetical protein